MGLAYFCILLGIAIAGIFGGALLVAALVVWKKAARKWLALLPLLMSIPCIYTALGLLVLFLREPPWRFHF